MASIYTQQAVNTRKTWLLMSLFFGIVIALGFVFARIYGNPNILYVFVLFSIVMNIVGYWFSDRIALSIAGAKPATREEYFDLYTTVENLAITAGLPMPKLYVIEDSAPNAFATGRDKNHAVVACTTGLLAIMNKTELEGVIAHELSHIGNKDMLVSTVAVVLVGFISIMSDMLLRATFFSGRRDEKEGSAMVMIIGVVLSILAPIMATLLQLAISRKREYLADASGALLTRYPEGLASALEKLRDHSQPMGHQSTAIAHLYIANPFGDGNGFGKKVGTLFSTHPPIDERIKVLRGM